MKILVINCGSSSLKYQLLDMDNEELISKGLVERIGIDGSVLTQKTPGKDKFILETNMETHREAMENVIKALTDKEHGVIKSMEEIKGVGHRIVHGGEKYEDSVIITDEVKEYIKKCYKLAPLHNPANIIGIEACEELMPNTPMVGVFDTAFHQSMEENVYLYALPYELYKDHRIRKYGFHGTSHKYVSHEAAKFLGKDFNSLKMITCHLGNGASLCAVNNGKSIDTTMGFTPLDGIVMGTRSGSVDPSIPLYLISELNYSVEEVDKILNKKSGVLGISGISSDFRDLEREADNGNEKAIFALKIYCNRIKKEIGAFIAEMGYVDVIVFTAGIGENSPKVRADVVNGLEDIGVKIDLKKNEVKGKETDISSADSKVKVLVIPTNEELLIGRDTRRLITKK